MNTYWVSTTESTEFTHLSWALTHSSLIALDAEWKPQHHTHHQTDPTFPTVSLLQLACRLTDSPPESSESTHPNLDDSAVFLVDLQSIPLGSIYEKLKEMFVSKEVLKLGFRFKQDLVFLFYTFYSNGFDSGFDRVEPFIDISSIYLHTQQRKPGRSISKNTKSLAAICEELLGMSLSKELQCSDWSLRPLTEEQKTYAAKDAYCLLEIFSTFQHNVDDVGSSQNNDGDLQYSNFNGESEVVERTTSGMTIVSSNISEASNLLRSTSTDAFEVTKSEPVLDVVVSKSLCNEAICLDESLSKIVCKYGSKILLKESDMKPKASKKKGHKQRTMDKNSKPKDIEWANDWQGRVPWELTNGGDGCPKFLCDVMIEGLAKRLRCVGIDAAVPYSKKPESRDLIEQARKEKRVLLTRDTKLLRHEYLIGYQIYKVESLNKDNQLKEVIETFQLTVSEDQLMSRCTKCNGKFIQKPLTTEEAVEAGKGFQKIPNCLVKKNLEFWQCMDCKQLYWEGTQYHNAIQNLSTFITSERNSKDSLRRSWHERTKAYPYESRVFSKTISPLFSTRIA